MKSGSITLGRDILQRLGAVHHAGLGSEGSNSAVCCQSVFTVRVSHGIVEKLNSTGCRFRDWPIAHSSVAQWQSIRLLTGGL